MTYRHFCKSCKNEFYGKKRQYFCSPECEANPKPWQCPECNGVFVGGHSARIYCSSECQVKANLRRQHARRKDAVKVNSYGHAFNPCEIESFFESEAERRIRLNRKQL